ncbi:universal stress protein [Streptomyces sp. CNQ085]|uniref:universal stress protein n=1 Tax=Streptomyces sp. CNQ085 TaxID=2886944 RepID=UPI001F50705E|nr:universal stress protein [Streptomyces sp. CNQ085]MCI0383087.1 universal stress protein [Streptomyces sp. CNQ085]
MTSSQVRRPIVVGVDPDPSRRSALAWAADEAARRRLPLRVVHAQGVPTGGYWSSELRPSWERWNEALHEAGERVLGDAVAFTKERQPRVEVSWLLAEGHPARVMREETRNAAMAVVSSWHLSSARELFGSAAVGLPLTAHAPCPVVVLREPERVTRQRPYLVVGVDGSPYSAAAVDFAFQEASLRGAALRAVHVWHPSSPGSLDEEAAEQEARRLLSESVAGRTAAYPEVDLRHEFVRGHPVQALAETSEQALGLVVGSHGRGGFTGMLLGSVSQGVLHHARCPVFTVPAADGRTS